MVTIGIIEVKARRTVGRFEIVVIGKRIELMSQDTGEIVSFWVPPRSVLLPPPVWDGIFLLSAEHAARKNLRENVKCLGIGCFPSNNLDNYGGSRS